MATTPPPSPDAPAESNESPEQPSFEQPAPTEGEAAPPGETPRDSQGRFVARAKLVPAEEAPQKGFVRSAHIKLTPESDPNVQRNRAFSMYDDSQAGDVFDVPLEDEPPVTIGGEQPPVEPKAEEAQPAVEGEEAPPAENEPKSAPTPEPPSKFAFAGEEWDTREKAEASFSTLRGQYKAFAQKTAEAEQRAARAEYLAKEALDQLRAAKEAPKSDAPAPDSQGADPLEEILKSINDKELDAAIKLYGQPSAMRLALYNALKAYDKNIRAELEQRFEPVRQAQQQSAEIVASANLFREAAALEDAAGEATFPELRDEVAMPMVAKIWTDLNMPREFAFSEMGIQTAILQYRELKRRWEAQQPPKPAAAPSQPKPPVKAETVRPSRAPAAPRSDTPDLATQLFKHNPRVNPAFNVEG